ncbi:hypothetical protein FVE85_0287 [Porphyridium purpureum]|uniref:Uncharacterized protein n=1 Tax=Porphyridium purpureum TaxID=35688 RepID=A0A5J4YZP1_PORPP|nr:hypothetical protein FVE85_0287 [Porphyridium purpureum]|eukprot:POR7721..scf208_2
MAASERLLVLEGQVSALRESVRVARDLSAGEEEVQIALWDAFAVRMQLLAVERGFTTSYFRRCPKDYYEMSLEQRRALLGAESVAQLCKSVVFENSRWPEYSSKFGVSDPFSWTYPRYVVMVVQYIRKLDTDGAARMLAARSSELSNEKVPRAAFNLRLAEDVETLTSYGPNAVTLLGTMVQRMPTIVSKHISRLDSIWLGGGQVDLKWHVGVSDLIQTVRPFLGDVAI